MIIPIGGGLIYFQYRLRNMFEMMKKEQPKVRAEEVFALALRREEHDSDFYHLLYGAFLLQLEEKGIIESSDLTTHQLPKEGITGEVRRFLLDIEHRRFAGKEEPFSASQKQQAKILFEKIRGIKIDEQ